MFAFVYDMKNCFIYMIVYECACQELSMVITMQQRQEINALFYTVSRGTTGSVVLSPLSLSTDPDNCLVPPDTHQSNSLSLSQFSVSTLSHSVALSTHPRAA